MKFTLNDRTFDIHPAGGGGYIIELDGQTVSVQVLHPDPEQGRLDFSMDGQRVSSYVSFDQTRRWVTVNGHTSVLTVSSGARRGRAGGEALSDLTAPMPGQVRSVNVEAGEAVKKGQTLLVIEAMKMEIRIQSPRDGIVGKLLVRQGQTVEREQLLIEIVENQTQRHGDSERKFKSP